MMQTPPSESLFWWSEDALRLHALVTPVPEAAASRPTLVCLPGLTRNARDFEAFAARYRDRFSIIRVDFRGRGDSAWAKDPLTYVPLTYARDLERLIQEQKLERMVFIGTSLGGIVTMLMAGSLGPKLVGAVLNDVGPALDPAGLARIRGYVGKVGAYPSWMHCAHDVQAMNKAAFPHLTIEDWLAFAKRVACLEPSGRIVFDYDPKIAEPFKLPGGEAGVDLWPAFDQLATRPLLLCRGERSDLLSAAALAAMAARAGAGARTVTVPGVGHAPQLSEPAAVAALDSFLNIFL
jgi:pimeloyl-ACP methyl ester carboxylesterase